MFRVTDVSPLNSDILLDTIESHCGLGFIDDPLMLRLGEAWILLYLKLYI